MSTTSRVLAAIGESGPSGASQAEIIATLGITSEQCSGTLSWLRLAGRVHGVGRRPRMRYFTDSAAAAAYAALTGEAYELTELQAARLAHRRKVRLAREQAKRPQKPAKQPRPFDQRILPAAVTIAKPKAPPAIVVPHGLTVQRGPSYTHDPRFQCAPGERVRGDFTALGVGRYIEEPA